ncbi:DMT family transporter [Denitrobaculum tricleocarpae]|uniref:DMT family transporter n=1 Tax=Denitrobaculum tricleocarpae TaxID=2591009 RepID=A0A545TYB7_9PROT|nr:DMT family transporter [Denitrobaculum tricleocarpae]TQV82222.1 DMT family transporter [Denitrobaculum tricleocarpae]
MSLPDPSQKPTDTRTGSLLILGAVFLMASQDALIKYSTTDLNLGQVFLLRSALVLMALHVIARGSWQGQWRDAVLLWPLARALFLTLMYVLLYSVISLMPLATLAAAFYTGPLFIVLLSAIFLKEPVSRAGWGAVVFGFLGVLVLLKPGSTAFAPLVLIPVLSGFCYAVAAVLTRANCQKTSPLSMALALNLCLLAAGIIITALDYRQSDLSGGPFLSHYLSSLGAQGWILIFVLAALMVGIGLGLAAAYRVAPPAVIASFDYSYLIFATLFGILLFSERPELSTLVGMGMIAGAGLLSYRANTAR